jgi:hypothetical protein
MVIVQHLSAKQYQLVKLKVKDVVNEFQNVSDV